LAFAGGSLLPLLFFAPWLWRRWVLLAGGFVTFGVWYGLFKQWNNLGLPRIIPLSMSKDWDFLLQMALLTAGGLHLLLLVAADLYRRRDIGSIILALWIMSGLFFAAVLNWTVSARSILPMVPAAAILLVRRLEAARGNSMAGGWLLWPLIPAAAVTLSLVIADYQLANSARTAAEQIIAKYKTTDGTVWFEGHSGFQYYMGKLGGQRIDVEQSLLQPGDIVVVPELGTITALPPGSVGWVEFFQYAPSSWMNLMCGTEGGKTAGFYSASDGPVPFVIGKLPPQNYFTVKVFSTVQYHTQPANRREVQAGGVPSFPDDSFSTKGNLSFQLNPEAKKRLQRASQCKADGKIEEAIQHCREALDVDSNNPVILNNLAWMLATANGADLRHGKEAVQLATRAVELTDYRQPLFIGTLAVTYAEAGDFSNAVAMAHVAQDLAFVTRQKEIFVASAKLLTLYSSGKTVGSTQTP
jgi:hypothetical protein